MNKVVVSLLIIGADPSFVYLRVAGMTIHVDNMRVHTHVLIKGVFLISVDSSLCVCVY